MPSNEKRILIVDDDEAIRALLFTILRRRGFALDVAKNGVEAMFRLRNCRYALILLDLMMPMKSGWEVMDELKKLPAGARPVVIVLTAGTNPRDLDPALVAASIGKPFEMNLLVDTIVACTNALEERPQLPDCPPADSTLTPPGKVN
jgi:two-component system, OmpR family, response regulator CpxR